MGGDHKCPVCQATFTRPQHVARHMRSHTGDRPYKCQYCGDQFARSDLLSRHVNKCHAGEKPLPNAGTTRRKGAVSATRATTSKQACDQCVQSSLPCDGCNPCSKCVSRKCRCTYVKFHRQTAPIGPGHNTRPTAPTDSASGSSLPSTFSNGVPPSRLPLYHQSDDEFVLGPAPGSVPTMADTLYSSNSFTFPPLYPNADLNGMPDNLEYSSKYRSQQPEFFAPGRSSMSTGLTPLYDPRHATSTPNPSWLGAWESQDAQDTFHHLQHQGHRQAELFPSHGPPSAIHDKPELVNHPGSNFGNHPDNPPIPMTMPYPAALALPRLHKGSRHQHEQGRNSSSSYDSSNSNSRRGSVDFSGSDGTSASHPGSVPCSANNSNIHLPLGNDTEISSLGYGNTRYSLATDRNATNAASSEHGRYDPQDDRQEFSSAFGLMSLDDPAVIAGLAVDGQPFFDDRSHAHNRQESTDPEQDHDGLLTADVGPDIDTPMPLKREAPHVQLPAINQRPATSSGVPAADSGGGFGTSFGIGNLPTPSKDLDSRELREFWKQYVRTPLSEPQEAIGNAVGPNVINSKNPSPTAHRRQRVASLPVAKTPMVERAEMFTHHPPGFGYHPTHQPAQRGRENALAAVQQGPTSSLRTTLHVKEDLRSYEAAVMARKAPTLNLQFKRPVKGKNASAGQQPQRQSSHGGTDAQSSNASPQIGYGSRPPSSSSIHQPSSTLANAFGNNIVAVALSRSTSGKEESVSPSLSSSRDTSVDICPTSASLDVELRPSFKRLASQTLGPENSKRAFFGYNADQVDEREKMVGWTATVPGVRRIQLNEFSGDPSNGTMHPERPVASIAERRRRRMSAPSSSVEKLNVSPSGPPQPTDVVHAANMRPLGYAPATQGGS